MPVSHKRKSLKKASKSHKGSKNAGHSKNRKSKVSRKSSKHIRKMRGGVAAGVGKFDYKNKTWDILSVEGNEPDIIYVIKANDSEQAIEYPKEMFDKLVDDGDIKDVKFYGPEQQ